MRKMMQRFAEARIIIPAPQNGRDEIAQADAEAAIREAFGGFTRTEGFGSWMADDGTIYREPVYVYDIAAPLLMGEGEDAGREWAGAMTALRRIAAQIARDMTQECVYLRSPAGRVHFIKPDGTDYYQDVEPHPFPRVSG